MSCLPILITIIHYVNKDTCSNVGLSCRLSLMPIEKCSPQMLDKPKHFRSSDCLDQAFKRPQFVICVGIFWHTYTHTSVSFLIFLPLRTKPNIPSLVCDTPLCKFTWILSMSSLVLKENSHIFTQSTYFYVFLRHWEYYWLLLLTCLKSNFASAVLWISAPGSVAGYTLKIGQAGAGCANLFLRFLLILVQVDMQPNITHTLAKCMYL